MTVETLSGEERMRRMPGIIFAAIAASSVRVDAQHPGEVPPDSIWYLAPERG
jgi:hypothetical protein